VYLAALVTLAVVAIALLGFTRQTRDLASVTEHENDCAHQAKEYSEVKHIFPGRVTAITPHYNERLHQCLIEVRCESTENGGKSIYEEIVDPETDHFVASRTRDVGEHGREDNTIVTGAPVRLDDEAGAQAWFERLMK
jgi:hypothetical protein